PLCASYRRPEPVLETLGTLETPGQGDGAPRAAEAADLERAARGASTHRRLPRIAGAERAPTGQAKCRHCHEPIPRGSWRIRLVFYEEGRFPPGGFLPLACRSDYFEGSGDDVIEKPLLHFSPDLSEEDRADLRHALAVR